MTTNCVDNLRALLRAGRADYKLNFDYSNDDQAKHMFLKSGTVVKSECQQFADRVSIYKYTPAILQKFLFKHRNDNTGVILKNIDEFSEMLWG